MRTEFVECHVGRVQVRRGGAGTDVVYLHSAQGEGHGLAFLDELERSFEVIAPMFPGYGESEGIDAIDDMEDATFHHLDLFDRLSLQRPVVVGASLGGWMAAELATRYPERLRGLVLVNPAGLYLPEAPVKDIFGRTPAELAEDMFADQSFPLAQMMHAMTDMRPEDLSFDLIRPVFQTMAATAKLAWDPYLHNPKLANRLHRVAVPTVVVHGEKDGLIPRAHAETYASRITDARLVDLADAAHLVAHERPNELAAVVSEFVASL